MYIRKTIIEGFMPFRDRVELNFPHGGIVGIQGAYGEDFEKSNRAGKSAFVDAQVWCLYGKARDKKAKDVELIYDTADLAYVSNELYDPLTDKSVTITRTRTKDNKGTLEISKREGEKKKVAQEEIDKIIGLNYEEFLFTAFFKQNDINQFMKADPQEKKQVLMTWVRTNNWDSYENQASDFKKELMQEQNKLKAQISSFDEFHFDTQELKTEFEQLTQTKKALEGKRKEYSDALVKHEIALKEIASVVDLKSRVAAIDQKITAIKATRPDSQQFADSLHKIETNFAAYPIISKQQYEEAVDKSKKAISTTGQLRAQIRELETNLKTMNSTMTGFCPLIKQTCSRIEKDPEAEAKIEQEIAGHNKTIARYTELNAKCDKIQKLYRAQAEWTSQKALLLEKSKNAKALEQQIADLSKERQAIVAKIPADADKKKEAISVRIYSLRDDIQSTDDEKAQIDTRIGEIGEALKHAKQKEERIDALKKELEEISQQLADAQYVEYMFGKNGIPSIELENSFQEIENDANVILRALAAPFHIEFEAMRELNDWEPNCLACGVPFAKGERTHLCTGCGTQREKKKRDELTLKVYEGGVERAFYLDSGGGQILQSAAIRLALTQLARRRTGGNWGTIFLDELFGQLDATNRRLMADLITSTLVKELGFEQIFMISHDPSVQSATASNLIVRRNQEELYSELILQ